MGWHYSFYWGPDPPIDAPGILIALIKGEPTSTKRTTISPCPRRTLHGKLEAFKSSKAPVQPSQTIWFMRLRLANSTLLKSG